MRWYLLKLSFPSYAESQLYSKIGSTEVVAKVDGRDIKETGSELKLGFDLNRSHFFDPESEISVY